MKRSTPDLVTATQTDLFSVLAVPLPDLQELARRYAEFNQRYFGNELPPVTIKWSKRMRIAGTCDSHRRIITLSHVYHEHFPNDVDDTLKHEMIHLRCPRHDAAFRQEAARIGTSVHCRDYPELHPRARFIYVCPTCGTEFPRAKRRAHLFCGRCARHGFDPRSRLVLRTSADNERAVRSIAAKSPSTRRTTTTRRRRRNIADFIRKLL